MTRSILRSSAIRLLAVLSLLCGLLPAVVAQSYTITDLGTLGGVDSYAYGVSNDSHVAGYSATGAGKYRAFRWTSGLGMVTLGQVNNVNEVTRAYGINQKNQIAGFYTNDDAVLWAADNTPTRLPGGTSYAQAVNDNSMVVGYAGGSPFYWTLTSGYILISKIANYTAGGNALGINTQGQIVGWCRNGSNVYRAFIFTQTGGTTDLGNILGSTQAYATGINNNSQIVGWATTPNTGASKRAFYKPLSGTGTNIGVLSGMTDSIAHGINQEGKVVGTSYNATESHAFLWTNGGGIVKLDTLLPANSGWQLVEARGINDKGQIVGWGMINGQTHGFLLSPVIAWNLSRIGVGANNKIRALWKKFDGTISPWTLTTAGAVESSGGFNAIANWDTLSIGATNNNINYLFWRSSSNQAAIWVLGSTWALATPFFYGPYAGWTPTFMTAEAGNNAIRLVWRHDDGRFAIWTIDGSGNIVSSPTFGPYAGWECTSVSSGNDGKLHLLWKKASGQFQIWQISLTGSIEGSLIFGPFTNYEAVKIAVSSYR